MQINTIDILSLISEDTELVERGNGFWQGSCVFHSPDTKPSMWVNPEKGNFGCFSCQTSGDAYTYVMNRDGVDFPTAINYFNGKSNICKVVEIKITASNQLWIDTALEIAADLKILIMKSSYLNGQIAYTGSTASLEADVATILTSLRKKNKIISEHDRPRYLHNITGMTETLDEIAFTYLDGTLSYKNTILDLIEFMGKQKKANILKMLIEGI